MDIVDYMDIVDCMSQSQIKVLVCAFGSGAFVGAVLILFASQKSFGIGKFTVTVPEIKKMRNRILLGACGAPLVLICGACALYLFAHVPTLVVWTGLAEDELWFFERTLVPGFKEMNEREYGRPIKVKVENREWIQTLQAFRDGKRVDVITFDVNGARRKLVSDERIASLSEYRELVPPSARLTLLEASEIDGERWFVPYRPNVRLLFLNVEKYKELLGLPHTADRNAIEKLIEELGTWTGVQKFGAALLAKGRCEEGVIINVKGSDAALFLLELVWSAGGEPNDLSNPKTKEAMECLRKLWPCVAQGSRQMDWQTASGRILSGQVALARNWTMQLSDMHQAGELAVLRFKVGLGWRWEGRRPVYLLGGECLALARNCKHRSLAVQFIRYLISKEVQEQIVAELSWPAMRSDVLRNAESWQEPYRQTIDEALRCAKPLPLDWYPVMAEIYEELFRDIVSSAGGDEHPDKANYQSRIDHYQSRINHRNDEECIQAAWDRLLAKGNRRTPYSIGGPNK